MHRIRVGLLGLAAALLCSAAVAAAASAPVKAKITIKAKYDSASGGYLISGTLKAKKKACVKGRVLFVYGKFAGVAGGYGQTAGAKVNRKGKWTLGKDYLVRPGHYFAKAGAVKVGKVHCKAAKSKVIKGKQIKPVTS